MRCIQVFFVFQFEMGTKKSDEWRSRLKLPRYRRSAVQKLPSVTLEVLGPFCREKLDENVLIAVLFWPLLRAVTHGAWRFCRLMGHVFDQAAMKMLRPWLLSPSRSLNRSSLAGTSRKWKKFQSSTIQERSSDSCVA
jgi:hypothetical protein